MKERFNSIESVIADLRKGKMVIVVDDADRENEGDLILAAEFVTPEAVNFMAKWGRGLICVPTTSERLQQLGIERMVKQNRESFKTDFQISVDAAHGIGSGISAADRAETIRIMADPTAVPNDLVQPGHVFPLRACAGGVLQRAGHTEAAVDLFALAAIVVYALCGQPPFGDGDAPTILARQLAGAADLSRFASPIQEWLRRALATSIEDRFRDATEMKQAWRHAVGVMRRRERAAWWRRDKVRKR